MLVAVEQFCPTLLVAVEQFCPALLVPWSPGPLDEVATMGLALPLAFADDTLLRGSTVPTKRAFTALDALAASLGPQSQPAKCAIHSTDSAAATAVAAHLCVIHAPRAC
jgi:hypothetical protein